VNLKKYITELKRRKVFKPAIAYLIVAWLIAQVFSVVFPAFNIPNYFMKTLIIILIIGFPLNIILAWIYDLTPQGIKKTKNMEAETSISAQTKAILNNGNKKLVVLPFHNASSENGSNYFSDGLTEEIIVRLSAIKELDIASRRTSMRYRDSELDNESLGRELNARYLLQGTVRRHKSDLRISTELIDIEKDSELWAAIYRGKIADVFAIQEKVSKKIVKSLQLKLSPKEKIALGAKATMNSKAHDANLKAREFLFKYTKSYLLLAIDLFQDAIDSDPKYAAAYAGMSEACALLYETHDRNSIWLAKAEESALKALIYDPSSSEAYSALGLAYYNKNSLNEALMAVQKAISFDHDNFFAYWIRGRLYRMMDRDFEAILDFNKVLEINHDFHSAFGDLQMAYEKVKDKKNLQDCIQKAALFYPSYLLRHPEDSRAHQFYALTLKRLGRLEEAKEEMNKGIKQNPNDTIIIYNAACFYSMLGDKKIAIENIKKAIDNGFGNYEYIKRDPDLNTLRKEPSFIALMKGR
jgi:TolB-like protein/Flp pilus assembly protein TadD